MASRLLSGLTRLAYVAGLLAVFGLSAYFSFNYFVRRGVTSVPDLGGLTEDAAQALLADHGLTLRRQQSSGRNDDRVPAGRILEHRPGPGSLVKRGAGIELVVSLGQRQARVPDVTGQAVGAAQVSLAARGLALGRTLAVASGASDPGNVVGQFPAAEAEVGHGGAVDVLVALDRGPDRFVMPDLVNLRYEPVRRFFESQGLRFGSVTFEPYEGLPPGVVLRQQPFAGHPLSRHRAIALVVSGPASGV